MKKTKLNWTEVNDIMENELNYFKHLILDIFENSWKRCKKNAYYDGWLPLKRQRKQNVFNKADPKTRDYPRCHRRY